MVQGGSRSISWSPAQASETLTETFAKPFTTVPAVTANIDSGSGYTATWSVRAISISTTGFIWFLWGPTSTWTSTRLTYVAVGA